MTIQVKELARALRALAPTVPKRSTLAALENIYIDNVDGGIRFLVSDLKNTSTVTFRTGTKIKESVAVPFSKFKSVLSQLDKNGIAEIDLKIQKETVTISAPGVSVELKRSDLVPPIDKLSDMNEGFEIPTNLLRDGFERAHVFASTNEFRVAMMATCFIGTEAEFLYVATDGHRLAEIKHEGGVSKENVFQSLVDPKAVTILLSLLSHRSGIVKVQVSKTDPRIIFSFNDGSTQYKLYAGVVDEIYPSYLAVIPKEEVGSWTAGRFDLMRKLELLSIVADSDTQQVQWELGNEVSLSAHNAEDGIVSKIDGGGSFIGNSLRIGFNNNFLLSVLEVIKTKDVNFTFAGETRAMIARPSEGTELFLVMPVRLNA